jgi:hypothetical protein
MKTNIIASVRNFVEGRMSASIGWWVSGCAVMALGLVAISLVVVHRHRPTKSVDPPLLQMTSKDAISFVQAREGILAIGATGSGKSSTLQHLMLALMRRGCGMLFLTAKGSDFNEIFAVAREAGRDGDLVRFAPRGPKFDFLNHELTEGGSIISAGQFLGDLVNFASRTQLQGGNEPFWPLAAKEALQHCMTIAYKANRRCSIEELFHAAVSLPTSLADLETKQFQEGFCYQCLREATEHGEDHDLWLARDYALRRWPRLGDKTSSGIQAHMMQVLNPFMHGDVRDLLSGEGSCVSPTDVINGKIVVVDMPVLTFREPGQWAQMVWKLSTIRAALRRVLTPESRDVVVWADEAQFHALASVDSMTQAVARSHRLINVNITQNLPLLISTLKSREDALAWIANLQTKFIFANGDKDTNEYFAGLLGQRRRFFGSCNFSQGFDLMGDLLGTVQQGSYGGSEQLDFNVRPEEFTQLCKGGHENGCIVSCFVFQGGRKFSNGKTYIKTSFKQMGG